MLVLSFSITFLTNETSTQGNIAKWKVKEGDKIRAGDVLAEIETVRRPARRRVRRWFAHRWGVSQRPRRPRLPGQGHDGS